METNSDFNSKVEDELDSESGDHTPEQHNPAPESKKGQIERVHSGSIASIKGP